MDTQRIVILNRLISISKTRARLYTAPTHAGSELLEIIDNRRKNNVGIEFENLGRGEDHIDDSIRLSHGKNHNFLRLREMRWDGKIDETRYAILLFEHVNQGLRSFPVVHTTTFKGREIEGEEEERGATAAHVVVRLQPESQLNLGNYRCAIEVVPAITRYGIETFLSRQLRRQVEQEGGWNFVVTETGRGKRPVTREIKYAPRLELLADVGRKFSGDLTDGRILTSMVFTKRKERQTIGRPATVAHEDMAAQVSFEVTASAPAEVVADLEVRVNANQGPEDAAERQGWAVAIRRHYENLGYQSRIYFRHATGGPTLAGDLHPAIAGATDLIMCPKEIIDLSAPPRSWRPSIDPETVGKMREILNNDTLWERAE